MTEAHRSIDVKLRELCDRLKGTPTQIGFADIAPLLREAADHIAEERVFLRAMNHCIQSTWRAVPSGIAQRYANDEAIASENRLPTAVAWMAGLIPRS